MYAKLSKYKFWMEKITFLGHIVSKEGVKPDPSKIKAIMEWEAPKNVTKIQSFLGLVGYYRKYVKDFSKITTLQTKLTKKYQKYDWEEAYEQSF